MADYAFRLPSLSYGGQVGSNPSYEFYEFLLLVDCPLTKRLYSVMLLTQFLS